MENVTAAVTAAGLVVLCVVYVANALLTLRVSRRMTDATFALREAIDVFEDARDRLDETVDLLDSQRGGEDERGANVTITT